MAVSPPRSQVDGLHGVNSLGRLSQSEGTTFPAGDESPGIPTSFTPRRSRGPWLALLGIMGACAIALFVLLFRLPGGAAIERSAEVATGMAELALLPADADTAARRAAVVAMIDIRLAGLRNALAHDGLEAPRLALLEADWQRARATLNPASLQALMPAAQTLISDIRTVLDDRQRVLEAWVKGLTALLAAMLVVPVYGLWRQRRQVRESLSQFSDDLGSGDWQDAIHALRHGHQGPPSAFDALATGVAGVLGESDRRWQALADLSADWYWESDAQHRITRLFGSVSIFTSQGWQVDDVIGWRHDQIAFFRAAGKDGWVQLRRLLDAGEALRDFEFSIVSRDRRTVRWVAVSARARTNSHGEFIGYEGVGRDVTERKRSLARLQASEQRWATMVRLASDWYWESDEQHRVLPLAGEHRQRLGAMADRVEGRTLWGAFPDAMGLQAWEAHRADLDAQRPFRSLELSVEGDDGQRHWWSISGVPRTDSAGRLRGYHGVGRNITARKEAERVLLRHNEELQRAVDERTRELQAVNRDLEAFARQLAHELRTPIGQVQGLAHLLQTRAGDRLLPDDRHLLALQVQSAGSMRDTVDALLTLAHSTMQPMPTEVVDLSALLHEVIDSLPSMQRSVPVRWTIQPALRAMAAPGPLRIVLINLLGNAAKFTRRRPDAAVQVWADHEGDGRLRVAVEDNGVGFDPGQASRLFTPFGRLHSGEDYHGTGIGLTIVHRIIERHGGTVRAVARPEGGARFEFTLPALPSATSAPAGTPASPAGAAELVDA
jgi:PAS domain S-box-containing protein